MKYFLFVSFSSGLKHNALYESLIAVRESLEQLVEEEGLDRRYEDIPTEKDLEKNFNVHFNDDFSGFLSNSTWFHIQEVSEDIILRMAGAINTVK